MNALPRILIVEDESLIALDLSRRLPKLGYEVCGMVATGEEAILKAAELRPSLILMDICLRGNIDGIEAAAAIRAQRNVPVIFLTANSDEKTLQRAKLSRPSSYLLKPFKERELQIGVEMALLNHGLQTELQAARDCLEQRVTERTIELGHINEALRIEIEARKRTEFQAREQADLLDKAHDAIYVRDLQGVIGLWNHSAERLYGLTESESIGQLAPVLLGEDRESDAGAAQRSTLVDGDWTGELRHRTKSGRELVVESRWTLVRNEAGTPEKILVVNTDITERKKVAEQMLRTQRLESVGALATGITHDLNNVFTPILMAADLMVGAGGPQRERIMAMVKASARRGADMVKQLLVFVRGGTAQMEPTAIDRLAEEVRKLMQDTMPCTIHVTTEIPKAGLSLVLGDTTQLHQVLVNLCINARDAMPEGGELRIGLEDVVLDESAVPGEDGVRPGRFVRLSVSDTGTGMPPELVGKIFEPFFTTKEKGKGTGLGLSTVSSIVRDHKGFLEVESEIGRGTKFLVYLPACGSGDVRIESGAAHLISGKGELIIVADDDFSVREMIKLSLEAHNYRVLVAEDGAEALTLYIQRCDEVALVITDVMMPIMNGRALIHALKKFRPDLPILAFSAGEKSNSLIGSLDVEGIALLRKPTNLEQLLVAIAGALKSQTKAESEAGLFGRKTSVLLGV